MRSTRTWSCMLERRVRSVVAVFAFAFASACGPQVNVLPEGDTSGAASSDAAVGDTGDPTIDPGASSSVSAGDDDDPPGGGPPGGEATGSAESGDDGDTDDAPPDVPAISLCDGDPYMVDPRRVHLYEECMRGLATFDAHVSSDGEASFYAYAQFYDVEAFAPVMWEEEILDPWSGPYDCALARYGNSGFGGREVVLWEDAGDVTFGLDGQLILAEESGDPVSVIGYTFSDESFAPLFGAPHGFVATGDTTPAFEFPDVVALPLPFDVLAPSLDGSAVVDAAELVLQWAPPYGEDPIYASLHVAVAGDWDFVLYCTGPDTGEILIPPELVAQLPLPTEARLHLRRADLELLEVDGGRFVFTGATTTTEGEILVQ